mmetsp:Transcript_53521/g.148809  ORF Transcript_53521/g.148809 Transcript_53521/m.148809 type:complete len:230 (-) Transcript_53521:461-1150(-)
MSATPERPWGAMLSTTFPTHDGAPRLAATNKAHERPTTPASTSALGSGGFVPPRFGAGASARQCFKWFLASAGESGVITLIRVLLAALRTSCCGCPSASLTSCRNALNKSSQSPPISSVVQERRANAFAMSTGLATMKMALSRSLKVRPPSASGTRNSRTKSSAVARSHQGLVPWSAGVAKCAAPHVAKADTASPRSSKSPCVDAASKNARQFGTPLPRSDAVRRSRAA